MRGWSREWDTVAAIVIGVIGVIALGLAIAALGLITP